MSKYKYDYYTVSVPGDCYDTREELGQLAIREAEERTKLYCLPCEWTAKLVAGELGDYELSFKVRRKRAKR